MTVGQHHISFGILMLGVALALGACSGPGTPPERTVFTMNEVAGSYEVTRMDAINRSAGGETTDLVALGAELDLTLTADGRTSGQLFMPEAARVFEEDPEGALVLDLTGTWTILETDPVIRFQFETDSFLALDGPLWSITEVANGSHELGADRGLVQRNRELELTLGQ